MPFSDFLYVTEWWALFLVYGLCALPFTYVLFRRFRDKGYSLSRIVGYLSVSYLMFVLSMAHILPMRQWSLCLCVGLLVLAEGIVLWRKPDLRRGFFSWLRSGSFWRHALIEEVFFFGLLLGWCYLRGLRPDLSSLEKPMNLGFINCILNADYMPAGDMWAAGLNINYYYFGHYCVACATKLSGILPEISYNLMMSTLFAAAAMGVFTLSYSLLGLRKRGSGVMAVGGGVLSAVMACLSGNLHYFVYGVIVPLLQKWGVNVSDTFLGIAEGETYSYWFPDATRYIGYQPIVEKDKTITEFPLYSFIISDLHPHVMNILAVLLFIGVALSYVLSQVEKRTTALLPAEGQDPASPDCLFETKLVPARFSFVPSPHLVVMGALIGIFSMSNFWDYPIYIVVSMFFFAYTGWMRYGYGKTFWKSFLYQVALLFALNYLISLPFAVGFSAMFSGIGIVTTRSKLYQLFVLWGVPFLLAVFFSLWLFLGDRKTRKAEKRRFSLAAFEPQDIFVLILCICAFGLTIGTELVYVRDIYEASYPRANTMFKLSYQAFILYGISAGYIVARLVDAGKKPLRTALAGMGMLLLCGMNILYAAEAIPAWYGNRDYEGLNGITYVEKFTVSKNEDGETVYPAADAVNWVRENTAADDVVLEVYGDSYTENCFISMMTGRQTVVGWQTHEWLWRNSYAFVKDRQTEVDTVYQCEDVDAALAVIEKYSIDYIVVGVKEKSHYGADLNTNALLTFCEEVWHEGSMRIFKVTGLESTDNE